MLPAPARAGALAAEAALAPLAAREVAPKNSQK